MTKLTQFVLRHRHKQKRSAIADLVVGWVDERKPNTLGTKIKCGRMGIG
ncbi:hypothetical protein [Gloeocapsa sp. PCC 73106]|nr:hypothetical protein [Gloeocapsa sp. PCC 73106]